MNPPEPQVDYRTLGKTIAHAIRHEPHVYELDIDAQGWTSIDALLDALRCKRHWSKLSRAHLQWLVDHQSKRRYEMDETRFRALYGHSIEGKLLKIPSPPPTHLFHGTPPDVAVLILKDGMRPMSRQYIHLSTDIPTAREVGLRKCKAPAMIRIDALKAHEAGHLFYEGNELVWLADYIPPEFMVIL